MRRKMGGNNFVFAIEVPALLPFLYVHPLYTAYYHCYPLTCRPASTQSISVVWKNFVAARLRNRSFFVTEGVGWWCSELATQFFSSFWYDTRTYKMWGVVRQMYKGIMRDARVRKRITHP